MSDTSTPALVREIGEYELIDRIAAALPAGARAQSEVDLGIGDDAALWTPSDGTSVVITTDALVEGVHFRLDWTDWTSLGHKMLAVNLSDIAAMGAIPRIATVVLGLTGSEPVPDIEALYQGAGALAAAHGVVIAGGDVVKVPTDVTLGVTVLGELAKGQALRRDRAQPGDLVVVSGTLGASAAGLALLAEEMDPRSSGGLLIAAQLRPNPRLALGRLLLDSGVACAMDLSDGLLSDLPKILHASGVSAVVNVDQMPVLPAVRALFPDRWRELALYGGEDYELLFTVPESRFEALQRKAVDIAASVTAIGRIDDREHAGRLELRNDGAPFALDQDAFKRSGRVNVEDTLIGQ
jgi:thiamine-monophosphate kinase